MFSFYKSKMIVSFLGVKNYVLLKLRGVLTSSKNLGSILIQLRVIPRINYDHHHFDPFVNFDIR